MIVINLIGWLLVEMLRSACILAVNRMSFGDYVFFVAEFPP